MTQHRLTAMLAAVVVAVFTSTALAGNGNGNGNGAGNGNSANAPGHQQPSSQPAAPAAAPATQPAAAAQSAPADKHATPPGQAKKQAAPAAQPAPAPATKHASNPAQQSKQSSTSAAQPATGGSNAQGVKPSNTTKHDTYAKASSNQTKQYGNGKTAGQIATQAGFGDATLHGPGNSQPHKTAPCPGGHEVDVHALKHKSSKCGAVQSAETKPAEQAVKHEEQNKAEKSEVEAATEQKVESQPCTATQTVTEQVLVGVKHMIGPKGSGRFVLIHPNTHSAHFTGKHPDDVPVFETVTKTIATPAANCASSQAQAAAPAAPAPAAPAPAAPAPAAAAPAAAPASAVAGVQAASVPAASAPMAAAPAAAGGVKGAVVALKPTKAKPAGGVLGTTTRLGGTVASSRLPFTGLPLWIFALVAVALIAVGFTVRRVSTNRM